MVARDARHQPAVRARTRCLLSASTVTSLRTKAVAEGDGVLQMLLWLNRSPESFVPDHPQSGEVSSRLPIVPAHQVLRFDTRKLHAALDAQRRDMKMTWAQVARETGLSGVAAVRPQPKASWRAGESKRWRPLRAFRAVIDNAALALGALRLIARG